MRTSPTGACLLAGPCRQEGCNLHCHSPFQQIVDGFLVYRHDGYALANAVVLRLEPAIVAEQGWPVQCPDIGNQVIPQVEDAESGEPGEWYQAGEPVVGQEQHIEIREGLDARKVPDVVLRQGELLKVFEASKRSSASKIVPG